MSTQVIEGRNGNVVLTICNWKGVVIFHETVKAEQVEKIVAHHEKMFG
jgi:hypothetical protein